MKQNKETCLSFIRKAKEMLSHYPQIKHNWTIDEEKNNCTLVLPNESENGFAIMVEIINNEITIFAGNGHINYEVYKNVDEEVGRLLGLVRDLLSPGMRIKELLAGGKPYKWIFEFFHEGKWLKEAWMGLIFWNYFGKRSEKIYQNNTLPAREKIMD